MESRPLLYLGGSSSVRAKTTPCVDPLGSIREAVVESQQPVASLPGSVYQAQSKIRHQRRARANDLFSASWQTPGLD
jgi:hypothetical protein